MLRSCLLSVAAARADEVYVCDDGSEFSVCRVAALALYGRVKYGIVGAPPVPVDTRMTVPRQGRLINEALGYITGDVATLVCDDDLLDIGWLDALRAHWGEHPDDGLVRGDWLQFTDGQPPSPADPPCPLDARGMTAGNFAWHMRLVHERGVRWPTDYLNCLDNGFLVACHGAGSSMYEAPHIGALAGWRRTHPYVNVLYTDGSRHTEGFREVLERGFLEP
jgi:hypothetical protein